MTTFSLLRPLGAGCEMLAQLTRGESLATAPSTGHSNPWGASASMFGLHLSTLPACLAVVNGDFGLINLPARSALETSANLFSLSAGREISGENPPVFAALFIFKRVGHLLCPSHCGKLRIRPADRFRAMNAFSTEGNTLGIEIRATLSRARIKHQALCGAGGMPSTHPGYVVNAEAVRASGDLACFVVFHI